MIGKPHVRTHLLSAGVGLVLAALYAASPLTVLVLIAAPVIATVSTRGLPAQERRWLIGILSTAFALRLLFVALQFIIALPLLNDTGIGGLTGDESYYLSRALRSRDLMLGFTAGKYDYFVANDDYGRTSYLGLLTWIQLVFGPTPYSMKVLNALLFIASALLLFRMAHTAFGFRPAFLGLAILLFLPSLFVSSVSLVKESLYGLVASALTVGSLSAVRAAVARRWLNAALALMAVAASLWLMNDLRRGALLIGVAGFGIGAGIRLGARPRWRAASAGATLLVVGVIVVSQPPWRARALDGVTAAATMHAGHVFTVGHAYKLLDDGFYKNPGAAMAWDITLTEPQAMRFLVRAAVSFLVTPLPWEMRSVSELAFMPEHMVWFLLLALLPVGLAAGWKRDPLVTSLLVGFALPAAAVVALTTGNVGTLLRLRGLVTPYIVWPAALALCVLGERLATRHPASRPAMDGPET